MSLTPVFSLAVDDHSPDTRALSNPKPINVPGRPYRASPFTVGSAPAGK